MTARMTEAVTLFQAKNAKQFSKALRRVNPVVPPRHEKRQTWEAERFAIVRLLKSIHRIPFPIILIHGDKPDFWLTVKGRFIAIEAVEAVPEVDAHRDRVIGGLVASGAIPNPIQSVVLRSPSDPVQSRKDAAMPNTMPHFYGGKIVEENWAVGMQHFIAMKLDKFSTYAPADDKWIMVYDNWPSVVLDIESGASRVHEWLKENRAFDIIDCVFIIGNDKVVQLKFHSLNLVPLKKPR